MTRLKKYFQEESTITIYNYYLFLLLKIIMAVGIFLAILLIELIEDLFLY